MWTRLSAKANLRVQLPRSISVLSDRAEATPRDGASAYDAAPARARALLGGLSRRLAPAIAGKGATECLCNSVGIRPSAFAAAREKASRPDFFLRILSNCVLH